LAAPPIGLGRRAGLNGPVDDFEQLAPSRAKGVECAGLDQRFEHGAAGRRRVDPFAIVEHVAERTVRLAFANDGIGGRAAAALDGGEPEVDSAVANRELGVRLIHVRRHD